MPLELAPVDCPQEVKYIYNLWLSLQTRRQGRDPVSYEGVESWSHLYHINLSPFEMDMIDRIERLYFVWMKKQEPTPK